jgi:Right handed beta helix region
MSSSSKCLFPTMLFSWKRCVLLLAFAVCLPAASRAQLVVDCTGGTPGAFTSINAALPSAGPGAFIFVTGPCNEDVNLWNQTNIFLGAWYGTRASVNGQISITNSHGVYLYGLNVSSATRSGISVSGTQALILDSCTSNDNAGNGLDLNGGSEALVMSPASFDNNATGGINVFGNSIAQLTSWGGQPIDISNNRGPGVYAAQASFLTFGHTTIANNLAGTGSLSGFGVDLRGGAKAQFGAISGPNVITGNQQGGVSLQETSEVSFWNGGSVNLIQNNGRVGVVAGFGSQVTFFTDVEVSGHSGPALDLYANSQGYLFGANSLHNNGVAGDPRSAAIRVDGNSEVFLRGGTVSLNIGPAILALVNSSADFTGVTFGSNSGGIIACDSSAYAVSDLASGTSTAPGFGCRVPHTLGNRSITKLQPSVPDWSALKALQARYMARATRK